MQGQILAAHGPDDGPWVVRRLVNTGALTERQGKAFIRRLTRGTPFDELILGHVPDSLLETLLAGRFRQNLLDFLSTPPPIQFQPMDTLFVPNLQPGHDTRALLTAIVRLRERIGPLMRHRGPLTLRPGPSMPASRDEARLVDLCDPPLALRDLLTFSPFETGETLDHVMRLLESGALVSDEGIRLGQTRGHGPTADYAVEELFSLDVDSPPSAAGHPAPPIPPEFVALLREDSERANDDDFGQTPAAFLTPLAPADEPEEVAHLHLVEDLPPEAVDDALSEPPPAPVLVEAEASLVPPAGAGLDLAEDESNPLLSSNNPSLLDSVPGGLSSLQPSRPAPLAELIPPPPAPTAPPPPADAPTEQAPTTEDQDPTTEVKAEENDAASDSLQAFIPDEDALEASDSGFAMAGEDSSFSLEDDAAEFADDADLFSDAAPQVGLRVGAASPVLDNDPGDLTYDGDFDAPEPAYDGDSDEVDAQAVAAVSVPVAAAPEAPPTEEAATAEAVLAEANAVLAMAEALLDSERTPATPVSPEDQAAEAVQEAAETAPAADAPTNLADGPTDDDEPDLVIAEDESEEVSVSASFALAEAGSLHDAPEEVPGTGLRIRHTPPVGAVPFVDDEDALFGVSTLDDVIDPESFAEDAPSIHFGKEPAPAPADEPTEQLDEGDDEDNDDNDDNDVLAAARRYLEQANARRKDAARKPPEPEPQVVQVSHGEKKFTGFDFDIDDTEMGLFEDHDRYRGAGQGQFTLDKKLLDKVDLRVERPRPKLAPIPEDDDDIIEMGEATAEEEKSAGVVALAFSAPQLDADQALQKIAVGADVAQAVARQLDLLVGPGAGQTAVQLLVESAAGPYSRLFHEVGVNRLGRIDERRVLANVQQRPKAERRFLLDRGVKDFIERALSTGAEELPDEALDALLEEIAGYQQRLRV